MVGGMELMPGARLADADAVGRWHVAASVAAESSELCESFLGGNGCEGGHGSAPNDGSSLQQVPSWLGGGGRASSSSDNTLMCFPRL